MTTIYWLIAAVAFLILEALTMGLTSIWFAGGALVGAVVAACKLPLAVQIVVFLLVSVLLFLTTRPLARRFLNSRTVKTNADSLIGETCIVTQTIDNLRAEGQVRIRGQVWTARSVTDDQKIAVDELVQVEAISGVKLIVKPAKKDADVAVSAEE